MKSLLAVLAVPLAAAGVRGPQSANRDPGHLRMAWLALDGSEAGVLARKAIEKGVYVGAGIAVRAPGGKTRSSRSRASG